MRVQRFLDFFYNEQDLSLGKYTKYFNDQWQQYFLHVCHWSFVIDKVWFIISDSLWHTFISTHQELLGCPRRRELGKKVFSHSNLQSRISHRYGRHTCIFNHSMFNHVNDSKDVSHTPLVQILRSFYASYFLSYFNVFLSY
jgi:hypothetical protein